MEYILDKKEIYTLTPDKMKGSLQMERADWSKLIEFEVSKLEKYITYMEWNVTKYTVR